jgi:phospholipase C
VLYLGIGALVAGIALSACAGGESAAPVPANGAQGIRSSSSSTPIQHIVLMIQENRSFNTLFAGFPGAVSTTTGEELVGKGKHAKEKPIPLAEVNLEAKKDLNHLYPAYQTAYQNGNMDGFNLIKSTVTGKVEGKESYQYVNPAQVQPYWAIGQQYALADEMFQTQGSGSFTAHQDLIRGGTEIDSTQSIIDDPTSSSAWGCDSPNGAQTSLITTNLQYLRDQGPFPCTNDFPSSGTYETLSDLLDAKAVSWKYYTPPYKRGSTSALWNAFDAIAEVRYGSEWGTNVNWPETNIFSDISNGSLPAMSWVIPDADNSDHPGYSDSGPSWVATVVNAIGQSQYWNSTAVIVVWDDWGGFYDPVAPPPLDNQGGPGFRVGMLAVSPYTEGPSCTGLGAVHTVYEFGSIIRFIEDTWNLGRLGTTDGTSTSIANTFNFNQSPCPFQSIASKYSRAFFLHQKPSGLPVDTE